MEKKEFAAQDAKEMASILRSAECVARYDKISHDILSEILVAAALDGDVEGGNRRGWDVWASDWGRVEVKSRILGTDGPLPRVSLRKNNLEKADFFVAIRWTRAFEFHDAVMLPKSAVRVLYDQKVQGNGLAHIAWNDWVSVVEKVSLKEKIRALLS